MRPARIVLSAALALGLLACSGDDNPSTEPVAATGAPVPDTGEPVTIGELQLTPCEDLDGVWCGSIEAPQDRQDPDAGVIEIGFEWHPRSDPAPAEGLLVAMEGGPGYATTASRDYFTELFAPLREHRDLLLMDLRGTGRSEPVDCPDLQAYTGDYGEDTGACGRLLGEEADDYGTRGGRRPGRPPRGPGRS